MDWSLTPAAILVRGLARIAEGFLAGWLGGFRFPASGFPAEREGEGQGGRESDLLSSPACAAVDLVSSSLHSVDARPPAR